VITNYSGTIGTFTVPEPGTMFLVGTGLAVFGLVARKAG